MPFCPRCHYEYEPTVSTCPDCGERLVSSLPEEPPKISDEKTYDDWVQLARLTSQHYADMITDALRSKDIPVVVISGAGHFGQTGQMGVSSFRPIGGGYSVMVPREFIDRADIEGQQILGEEWEKAKFFDVDE